MRGKVFFSRRVYLIPLVYLIFGVLWITTTDLILESLPLDREAVIKISLYKGWAFIGLSSIIIYLLMLAYAIRIQRQRKSLEDSEAKYRNLAETSHLMILTLDEEGAIVYANPETSIMLGVLRLELIQQRRKLSDFVGKNDAVLWERLLQSARETPERYARDVIRMSTHDGKTIYADVSVSCISEDGKELFQVVASDITELKRMEMELKESESRHRLLLASIPEPVIGLNEEFNVLYSNPALQKLVGLTGSQIEGKNFFEVFPDLLRSEIRRTMQSVLERGENEYVEIPYFDHFFLIHLARTPFGLILVMTDVTERKEAEKRALEASRLYSVLGEINEVILRTAERQELLQKACQTIVEKGGFIFAWIGLVDEDTNLVEPVAYAGSEQDYLRNIKISIADDAHGRGPTGTAIREGISFVCSDIESDPRMLPWRDEALKRGYRSSAAFPLRIGEAVIGALNVYSREKFRFLDEEKKLLERIAGNISFALAKMESAEKQRLTLQSLIDSEERYRTLFDEVPVGLVICVDKIVLANKAAASIFGVDTPEALIGKDILPHIAKAERKRFEEHILRTLTGLEASATAEYELTNVAGKRIPVEICGVPMILGGKPAVLIFIRDISELKTMQEILLRTQKLEAIGNLAAGITHDINNTLTALLAQTEMLRQRLIEDNVPEKSLHPIELMEKTIEKSAGITRRLLAFSRAQVADLKALSLNASVRDAINLIAGTLREDVSLAVQLSGKDELVMGDYSLIEQIIINLCLNAKDAMPSGGRLLVATEAVDIDEDYARTHPDAKPGRYGKITITDTGIGMTPEVMSRIFEPFFTTKPEKGTGLGLAMVYGSVRQMNGFIHVYSEPLKGTTFSVFIPSATQQMLVEEKPAQRSLTGTETILLAEDEDMIREAMAEVLRRNGYKVLTAENGEKALELIRENIKAIDLAFLDTIMPKKSGREVFEETVKLAPNIRFLFTSGYSLESPEEQFIQEKGLDFIGKPYSPTQLLTAIREVLDRRRGQT